MGDQYEKKIINDSDLYHKFINNADGLVWWTARCSGYFWTHFIK